MVILEDIALDATIDDRGRLVADTSVRQIAANLELNKTTVARHVARLRDHGFVLHEETRDGAYQQPDPMDLVLALPVFAWEVSFALWLIIKGFKTPRLTTGSMQPAAADPALSPA